MIFSSHVSTYLHKVRKIKRKSKHSFSFQERNVPHHCCTALNFITFGLFSSIKKCKDLDFNGIWFSKLHVYIRCHLRFFFNLGPYLNIMDNFRGGKGFFFETLPTRNNFLKFLQYIAHFKL